MQIHEWLELEENKTLDATAVAHLKYYLIDMEVVPKGSRIANDDEVIVPREPSKVMIEKGYGALPDCGCTDGKKYYVSLVYKAMIEAAHK